MLTKRIEGACILARPQRGDQSDRMAAGLRFLSINIATLSC
jgi:hypothetical protein